MHTKQKLPVVEILRHRVGTDGTGIRTLIIVEGCPLRCRYCINPETWDGTETIKEYSLEELYDEIKIDDIYFQATNGGITFGGGEPVLYAEFIANFIELYCDKWNVCIETSLNVPWKNIKLLIGKIDHYYIDIKTLRKEIYKEYTGGDLHLAVENLKRVLAYVTDNCITVRVPVIPDYTEMKDVQMTKEQLIKMGVKEIDIFEYKTWI